MKENFQTLDQHLRDNNMFNGNILVADKQEILYSASFGHRLISPFAPVNYDTIFELASVSKQFTAFAALKTFKDAGISLNTDIRLYLTNFPYEGITLKNLLNHTSGLPDYMELFLAHWDHSQIATNKDVLELMIRHKPQCHFQPGIDWEYSNTGYVLLALIIEQISKLPFPDVLQKQVFHPLNMTRSFVYNRRFEAKKIENYAFGYVFNPTTGQFDLPDNTEGYELVYFLDGIQGDGTVNSTLGDLLIWNNAILDKKIPEDLRMQMFSETQKTDGESIGYGMGWLLDSQSDTGNIVYHSGGWPGYTSYNAIYTDRNISVILLCNQAEDLEFQQQLINTLENIVFEKSFELPVRKRE